MGSSKTTTKATTKPLVSGPLQSQYDQLLQFVNNPQMFDGVGTENPYAIAAQHTPDELTAYNLVRNNTGQYKQQLDASIAAQMDALARSGRAPTQAELDQYMNPFTDTVLNRSIERMQEDADRGFRDISGNAALTKAFGGSRHGLLEAELARNLNKNVGDTYYSGMKDNYDQGLSAYFGQLDRLSTNAGRGISAAGAGQGYGLVDAAALETQGRTQRERLDRELGLKSEDFLRLEDQKYKDLQAKAMAIEAISPGSIGQSTNQTTKTSENPLKTILGAATAGIGLLTGNPAAAGSSLSSLTPVTPNLTPSFTGANLGAFAGSMPWIKGWKSGGRVDVTDSSTGKDIPLTPFDIALFFKSGGRVDKYADGGGVKYIPKYEGWDNAPIPYDLLDQTGEYIGDADAKLYAAKKALEEIQDDSPGIIEQALLGLFDMGGIATGAYDYGDETLSAARASRQKNRERKGRYKVDRLEDWINKRDRPHPEPRGYAYGGRVGNSFSQGESADVIKATRNPFTPLESTVPGNPSKTAMPGIFGVNDSSPNSLFAMTDKASQAYNANPDITATRDRQMNDYGFTMFPVAPMLSQQSNTVPQAVPTVNGGTPLFNPGPVAPELMNPPPTGGNPVATLLDSYKTGVRTDGMFLGNNPTGNRMGAPDPTGPRYMDQAQMGSMRPTRMFSEGGAVRGYAEGGDIFSTLFGQNTAATPSNAPKSAIDTLFSGDGLLKLGLGILASEGDIGQAIGKSALGVLNEQGAGTNPLDQLKLEYQMLQNQDLRAKTLDREEDDAYRMERDRIKDALAEARMLGQEERFYASLSAQEQRALAAEEGRDRRAQERTDKPQKFNSSMYPGLSDDIKTFKKIQNGEIPEGVSPQDVIANIESTAELMASDGYEDEAVRYLEAVKPYKRKIDQARQVGKSATEAAGKYFQFN